MKAKMTLDGKTVEAMILKGLEDQFGQGKISDFQFQVSAGNPDDKFGDGTASKVIGVEFNIDLFQPAMRTAIGTAVI